MRLRAGEFDQRIDIEQRLPAQDALGQPIETWTRVAAVWASIRHPAGLQAIKASADVSTTQASIRLRYRASIDASMRVVHGADVYDIKAVLPNRGDGYTDLVCERLQ